MACILVASLAVNAVGVGIRQIWPLVASLGYGLTTRDIGEMFSLRMFSIVLMVALGGVVQSAAPPRVVVAVASAVLTVVCVLWSLPPAVLSPFVFKVRRTGGCLGRRGGRACGCMTGLLLVL